MLLDAADAAVLLDAAAVLCCCDAADVAVHRSVLQCALVLCVQCVCVLCIVFCSATVTKDEAHLTHQLTTAHT